MNTLLKVFAFPRSTQRFSACPLSPLSRLGATGCFNSLSAPLRNLYPLCPALSANGAGNHFAARGKLARNSERGRCRFSGFTTTVYPSRVHAIAHNRRPRLSTNHRNQSAEGFLIKNTADHTKGNNQ